MKTLIIALCVFAAVIGIFAFLSIFGKSPVDVETTVQDVSVEGVGTTEEKKPVAGVGSFLDLQALNSNLECQIKYTANDGKEIEGTYFISEGKMRGDFVMPAPEFGGEIVSSMIHDGPVVYVWSKIGEETYGFRSDKNVPAGDGRVDSKEPIPTDAEVRYSCTPWEIVDGSVFVPPSTVEFKDLNELLKSGMEYGVPEF